jgi:hypothetical protein
MHLPWLNHNQSQSVTIKNMSVVTRSHGTKDRDLNDENLKKVYTVLGSHQLSTISEAER